MRATGPQKGKGKTGVKNGGGLQVKVEETCRHHCATVSLQARFRTTKSQPLTKLGRQSSCANRTMMDGAAKVGKVAEWNTVAMFDWRAPTMHVEQGTTPGFITTLANKVLLSHVD